MNDPAPLWVLAGFALGWVMANPRELRQAIAWIDRKMNRLIHRASCVQVSRPPTPSEVSAHRLGIAVGLMEAEGILSDIAERFEKAEGTAAWASDAIMLARNQVLARRVHHQGEWERNRP